MFLETKTDDAVILLDQYIAKKREWMKLQKEAGEHYRALCIAETEQLASLHQVSDLEGRIKSFHKKVFTGEGKPGDLPILKLKLEEARKDLDLRTQSLGDQRDSLCAVQAAQSQISDEIEKLCGQLLKDMPALFMKRFGEDDPNAGKRGLVVWADKDPNGVNAWRRQWKGRVFRFLFHHVANNTNELHFLSALAAFFKSEPFYVRIRAGFHLDRSGVIRKMFDVVGDQVLVPDQLDFEDAFEEIIRGRVEFVSE